MNDDRPAYHKRAFLNTEGHHSTAAIQATVDRAGDLYQPDRYYQSASIKIVDCSRAIDLDFDVTLEVGDPHGDLANAEHKLDLLIQTLQDFRRAYRTECRRALRLLKANAAK